MTLSMYDLDDHDWAALHTIANEARNGLERIDAPLRGLITIAVDAMCSRVAAAATDRKSAMYDVRADDWRYLRDEVRRRAALVSWRDAGVFGTMCRARMARFVELVVACAPSDPIDDSVERVAKSLGTSSIEAAAQFAEHLDQDEAEPVGGESGGA